MCWIYVPGEDNPADLPSRGCTALQLKGSKWWEGSSWLNKPSDYWPVSSDTVDERQVQLERKKALALNLIIADCKDYWYIRASSYAKNVCIMAYVLRFVRALKKRECTSDEFSVEELNEAEKTMLLLTQRENFQEAGDIIDGIKVVRDNEQMI